MECVRADDRLARRVGGNRRSPRRAGDLGIGLFISGTTAEIKGDRIPRRTTNYGNESFKDEVTDRGSENVLSHA